MLPARAVQRRLPSINDKNLNSEIETTLSLVCPVWSGRLLSMIRISILRLKLLYTRMREEPNLTAYQ